MAVTVSCITLLSLLPSQILYFSINCSGFATDCWYQYNDTYHRLGYQLHICKLQFSFKPSMCKNVFPSTITVHKQHFFDLKAVRSIVSPIFFNVSDTKFEIFLRSPASLSRACIWNIAKLLHLKFIVNDNKICLVVLFCFLKFSTQSIFSKAFSNQNNYH